MDFCEQENLEKIKENSAEIGFVLYRGEDVVGKNSPVPTAPWWQNKIWPSITMPPFKHYRNSESNSDPYYQVILKSLPLCLL